MSAPVAVITGASRGIGKRLAVDLAHARLGHRVRCALEPRHAEQVARHGGRHGGRRGAGGPAGDAVSLDVQSEDATAALAERVYREWGRCDLLINNAAIAPPRPALEDSIRRWRLAVDINVNGPFSLTWHFGRRMMEQGVSGRVINVSSGAAVMPSFGRPSYTATKLALEGMTESLGHELAAGSPSTASASTSRSGARASRRRSRRPSTPSGFEDAAIMTDAVLWLVRQDLSFTGKILLLTELRRQGIVRPETAHRS